LGKSTDAGTKSDKAPEVKAPVTGITIKRMNPGIAYEDPKLYLERREKERKEGKL
jgi:hypothetical protein